MQFRRTTFIDAHSIDPEPVDSRRRFSDDFAKILDFVVADTVVDVGTLFQNIFVLRFAVLAPAVRGDDVAGNALDVIVVEFFEAEGVDVEETHFFFLPWEA